MEIFALDIGTRSVVGILGNVNEKTINIEELIYYEHENRSMLDGQIHNVPEVSKVVKTVKEQLEQKTGKTIKEVAIAAAGRSLKTATAKATFKNISMASFSSERVLALELEAVQLAQQNLLNDDNKAIKYYCVGYSVVNYYLEDTVIGSLIGQKGEKASVEVVATFLPRVVVDSLQTVVKEASLELKSITLEPIAAINLVIPQTMRRLNLVLVDIGAGTSDIAICSKGTITAYGMVPIAGDEITESLCDQWLLDFSEGERIKRLLLKQDIIEFTNVLGILQRVTADELVQSIEVNIDKLAQAISEEILRLNGQIAPQAILCIGGGSQTPLLGNKIALALNIPSERVAIQKAANISGIVGLDERYMGPDIITPIGIGVTSVRYSTMGFINATINDQKLQLLDLGKNTIIDALLASGINIKSLYGQPGLAKTLEINGKVAIFSGSMGTPAEIFLNGEKATLGQVVNNNDHIVYISGKKGNDAEITLNDIIKNYPKYCYFNNKKVNIFPKLKINNNEIYNLDISLNDNDKISIDDFSIENLLQELECNLNDFFIEIQVQINQEKKKLPIYNKELFVNNSAIKNMNYILKEGDRVILKNNNTIPKLSWVLEKLKINNNLFTVKLNGQKTNFPWGNHVLVNGNKVDLDYELKQNDTVSIITNRHATPMVADFLALINFDPNPPAGKRRLDILINTKPAEYITTIKEYDDIKLIWS